MRPPQGLVRVHRPLAALRPRVVVVVLSVVVTVGAGLNVADRSGGTRVLWRGFVRQLGQSGLELSADADVLVQTWDLNIQLRSLLFLFLFFTLTTVYEHGSVGERLLMLIGPGWRCRRRGGFLGTPLHGQLLQLLRWRLELGLRGHYMFSESIPPMKGGIYALHHNALKPSSSTSSHAADHLHAVSLSQGGAVLSGRSQWFAHLLEGLVHHGRAVRLEGLDRQLHHAGDQLRTAAPHAAEAVAGQIRRAGGGAEGAGGVRWRRPRHVVPQHVRRGCAASRVVPLLFGIRQLGRADRVRDGASYASAPTLASINTRGMTRALAAGGSSLMGAVRHWLTVADLQDKRISRNTALNEEESSELQNNNNNKKEIIPLNLFAVRSRARPQPVIGAPLPHLWLAVHQSLRLAVSARVADVQTAQRLAVQVVVGGGHAALLPHDGVVLGRGPVGRSNDGAVPVAGDVVGAHELAAGDAEAGGHGGRGDEGLGLVERAQAGAAVHAAVGRGAVTEGKVHLAAVQTRLRLVVGVIVEDAV